MTVSDLLPPSTKNVNSSLLLPRNTSLKNPQWEVHPLFANRKLRLVVWTISRKDYVRREFLKQLSSLLQVKEEKVQSRIANLPEECGSLVQETTGSCISM